jgi:HAD superfamily hydrolase (TIGR01490 family)
MKKYVAFFDLDLTLINGISGKILMQQAYKYGIMSSKHIFQGFLFSFLNKFNLMNPDSIMNKMVTNLEGISESQIINLIEDIFDDQFLKIIRDEAKSEIVHHKNNKGKTVILSASLPYVCEPIKYFLDMDDIICSRLEIMKSKFTGKPDGPFCYGKEKYLQAIRYCENNNYSFNEAYFYSDSISDLPLLQVVGNPICVSPDKSLRYIAQKSGWKIYNW